MEIINAVSDQTFSLSTDVVGYFPQFASDLAFILQRLGTRKIAIYRGKKLLLLCKFGNFICPYQLSIIHHAPDFIACMVPDENRHMTE